MATNEEFEKQKLIYEKVSEKHNFFLSWRQNLFAGYFAVLAALFYSCFQLHTSLNLSINGYSPYAALAISFISLLFLILEERNRILYQEIQKVGKAIEEKFNLALSYKDDTNTDINIGGLYSILEDSHKGESKSKFGKFFSALFTHTWAMRILYVGGTLSGVLLWRHL